MPRNSRTRKTQNDNIECDNCDRKGVTVISGPTVQFQTRRKYKCNHCDHLWKREGGDRKVISQGTIPSSKNPIDYDRELGVVPDN